MNKTSDYLNMPVLSLQDARIVGDVHSVLFDENAKGAIYLSVLCDSKLMLLEFGKILCRADAIVIDSTLSLIDACDVDMTAFAALDGKHIFAQNGEDKGKISHVELFANCKTAKIVTDTNSFTPTAFQNIGEVLILKQAKKRVVHHTIPRDKIDRKVEMLENSTKVVQPAGAIKQPKKMIALEQGSPLFSQDALEKIVGKEVVFQYDDDRTPARIISDYDFLLGRTLLHDLTTYAGILLAPQGTIVTKELVELASRNGKLVDLTLNSSYK